VRACKCPHCGPGIQGAVDAPVVHEPITLPTMSRPFRVHRDGRTQDCTLHPDGRLTTVMAGQEWVSALSFDEMRERNWADAEPEPAVVQDALIPTA
jgi:hypothetical protein